MKKIGVCGHLANGHSFSCGQTVKTRIFLDEIRKRVGDKNTISVDTFNWSKNPIRLFLNLIVMTIKCSKILIFPGKNGLKVIMPISFLLAKILKKDIYYIVVGGWLPEYVKDKRIISMFLKRFDGIYIESKALVKEMNNLGYKNVKLLHNTKSLDNISFKECKYIYESPIRVCTFSRVMKEKGITDIINAISFINNKYGSTIFTLDIYGKIDDSYRDEFINLLEENNKFINYCGIVDYRKTVQVIKKYYMLIFPTYYEGECFPGTIIDAFSSGVPVLASDWKYNNEFISNMETGILYDVNDINNLINSLIFAMENPDIVINMRSKCLEKSYEYTPNKVINRLMNLIEFEGVS